MTVLIQVSISPDYIPYGLLLLASARKNLHLPFIFEIHGYDLLEYQKDFLKTIPEVYLIEHTVPPRKSKDVFKWSYFARYVIFMRFADYFDSPNIEKADLIWQLDADTLLLEHTEQLVNELLLSDLVLQADHKLYNKKQFMNHKNNKELKELLNGLKSCEDLIRINREIPRWRYVIKAGSVLWKKCPEFFTFYKKYQELAVDRVVVQPDMEDILDEKALGLIYLHCDTITKPVQKLDINRMFPAYGKQKRSILYIEKYLPLFLTELTFREQAAVLLHLNVDYRQDDDFEGDNVMFCPKVNHRVTTLDKSDWWNSLNQE